MSQDQPLHTFLSTLFLSTLFQWGSCPIYGLKFHLSADIPKFISPAWTTSLNSTLLSICLFMTFSGSLRGIWKLASPKLNSAFPHHTIRPPPGNAIVSYSSQNFCINHPWLSSFSHPRNKALASPCELHIQDVPWIFLFLSISVLPPHQITVIASYLVSLLLPSYPDRLKIIFHSHGRWHCPSTQNLWWFPKSMPTCKMA